jgi:methyl-accepting chemotaxis protein
MKTKITGTTVICFLAGMLVVLLTLFFYLRFTFNNITEDTFEKQAAEYGNMIRNQFENPVSFLSGLSSVAEAQTASGNADRVAFQQWLFRAFDEYKIAEGVGFMMEPNAYDGSDGAYAGTNYGTERSGRISYYYYRENGRTMYQPKVDEDESEFDQEYYTLPKERKQAVFTDPYLYTVGGNTVYVVTASHPVMNDSGAVIGVLLVDMHLSGIHESLSNEKIYDTGYIVVTTEAGKVLYSPNLDDVGKDAAEAGVKYELPESGESVRHSKATSVINGKSSVVATMSVDLDLADSSFYVSVVAPESEANAAYISLLILMFAIFAVICLIIALTVNITTGRALRPLGMMMNFLKRVGETGDLTLTEDEWQRARAAAERKDEIGQSLAAFVKMLEHLTYCDLMLRTVSDRDLSAEIKTLGDRDTIGLALSAMVDNLNEMLREIHLSANQVSQGSQQIADGSQSLAQGATEQADSVEQLSVSVTEVHGSVVEVTAAARNLAEHVESIKVKAEQGTVQMNEMMEAVREINEASQSISSVIKIIDDIAFQTNILALNAAVEAARAGQYGKGFAVVAEEVRSLAAKSAEAAKNTGSLIENSVSKAELGVRIAGWTSESLGEIVDGVVKSSGIIDKIASDTSRQSVVVEQIDANIGQITQVVQMNTATAEESAAASEELSGQSELLNNLINRFAIKDLPSALPLRARQTARAVPSAQERIAARPPRTGPAAASRGGATLAAPAPAHRPERFVWSKELETGNELIDSQHKQLIEALGNLTDACSGGKGRAVLTETMDFLERYTAKHFGDEEALQKQHDYPDYPGHKRLHDGFKRVVADIGRQLKAEGPTIVLVGKVNTDIGGWLINHIKREDTKVAAHLRNSE